MLSVDSNQIVVARLTELETINLSTKLIVIKRTNLLIVITIAIIEKNLE